MSKLTEKLIKLDRYLQEKYHLTLAEAVEEDDDAFKEYLSGNKEINQNILIKIAEFFFLDVSTLVDDEKELPDDNSLQVDEIVVNARKDEYQSLVEKKKNKQIIKRSYSVLDQKKKKKLWINLALTFLPFLAFVFYSLITVCINNAETLATYREGDKLSASQQAIEDSLPKNGEEGVKHYAEVKVGTILESISNVSATNGSYTATMTVRFDFDQYDYHEMWWEKTKGEKFNSDNFYTEEDLLQDNWCFDSTKTTWLNYSDNIPDILQFNFEEEKHLSSTLEPTSISSLYTEERAAYPGEKSSNIYQDKNDEFSIGNGKISADSLEYLERGVAYYDEATKSYRFMQKLHFTATINKSFDSPRYPLDSAQFHIYIQPTRKTDMIRYVADKDMSGFSTYFSLHGGYRLVKEKNGIKNLSIKLNYYQEVDKDPSSSTFGSTITKTQFEIIVRANKHGISVFINSFLNIIAVAIWLILAFFNQSFNKQNSISMIGTGFFSAISAILLGFSLVSNANIFSLLSVVNIFTLGMVLTMGYESIAINRAQKLNDASAVAYRTVKARVLFYFLVACSVVMYLILPLVSYLWIL